MPSPFPADRASIGFAPISIDEMYRQVDDGANGAIVLMSGMVRDSTDSKPVAYLEYQAYEPMAMQIFAKITAEIRTRWTDIGYVAIQHRVGKLQIGEISVVVAVGAPHRGEAFAACQYAIDTLKHQAPIWKKEYWRDGASSWVNIGECE